MKRKNTTIKITKEPANRFPRTRLCAFIPTAEKEEKLAEVVKSDVEIEHVSEEEGNEENSQTEIPTGEDVQSAFDC